MFNETSGSDLMSYTIVSSTTYLVLVKSPPATAGAKSNSLLSLEARFKLRPWTFYIPVLHFSLLVLRLRYIFFPTSYVLCEKWNIKSLQAETRRMAPAELSERFLWQQHHPLQPPLYLCFILFYSLYVVGGSNFHFGSTFNHGIPVISCCDVCSVLNLWLKP